MCNLDFVMIYGDKRYCGTWFEGSVSSRLLVNFINISV